MSNDDLSILLLIVGGLMAPIALTMLQVGAFDKIPVSPVSSYALLRSGVTTILSVVCAYGLVVLLLLMITEWGFKECLATATTDSDRNDCDPGPGVLMIPMFSLLWFVPFVAGLWGLLRFAFGLRPKGNGV